MKRKDNTEKTKETYITSNFNISYNGSQVYLVAILKDKSLITNKSKYGK